MLYQPELGPSASALLAALAGGALVVFVYALWSGRIDWNAPREQQLDVEQES